MDCTINISRPDEGPHAGLIVLKYFKNHELVLLNTYSKVEQARMALRRAGLGYHGNLPWARLGPGSSTPSHTVFITNPPPWFWGPLDVLL